MGAAVTYRWVYVCIMPNAYSLVCLESPSLCKNANPHIFRNMNQIDKKFDRQMCPTTEASCFMEHDDTTISRWWTATILNFKKYKSAVDWDIGTEFCVLVEISSWETAACSKYPLNINSRWRRPSFWIWFRGHNLGFDQTFITKFGKVMDNEQSKAIHES